MVQGGYLQQKVVYVRAKPERQVHHGLEQTTLSESVHAWLGCYLRPNSYLLRGRVQWFSLLMYG